MMAFRPKVSLLSAVEYRAPSSKFLTNSILKNWFIIIRDVGASGFMLGGGLSYIFPPRTVRSRAIITARLMWFCPRANWSLPPEWINTPTFFGLWKEAEARFGVVTKYMRCKLFIPVQRPIRLGMGAWLMWVINLGDNCDSIEEI